MKLDTCHVEGCEATSAEFLKLQADEYWFFYYPGNGDHWVGMCEQHYAEYSDFREHRHYWSEYKAFLKERGYVKVV